MDMVETLPSSSNVASASTSTKSNGINGYTGNTSQLKPNGSGSSSNSTSEQNDSEGLEKLVEVCIIVLQQAVSLVDENLSEDAQLTRVSKFIPGSTIGKHLRHATDHFSLLLDSLSSSPSSFSPSSSCLEAQKDVELSYDVRTRGTPMESSRAAAREVLESCIARLQSFSAGPGIEREKDRTVRLTAVTPYVQTFRTSFGRELWFAALHAVHHWSMVRVIAGELGIQLDDSFGVAPSTLVYRGSEGPLGKAKI